MKVCETTTTTTKEHVIAGTGNKMYRGMETKKNPSGIYKQFFMAGEKGCTGQVNSFMKVFETHAKKFKFYRRSDQKGLKHFMQGSNIIIYDFYKSHSSDNVDG